MLKIDKNINFIIINGFSNTHEGRDIYWIHYADGLWVIAFRDGRFIATTEIVTVYYKEQ